MPSADGSISGSVSGKNVSPWPCAAIQNGSTITSAPVDGTTSAPALFEFEADLSLVIVKLLGSGEYVVERAPHYGLRVYMGQAFRSGTWLTRDGKTSPPIVIVNERLARMFWPDQYCLKSHSTRVAFVLVTANQ